MKSIGIFADISNLYYCIANKYPKHKLNYQAYLDYCKDLGEIRFARAYGASIGREAQAFIRAIEEMGWETFYKEPKVYHKKDKIKRKCDWDVGIAVDMIQTMDKLDIIILGSADGDMSPAVAYAVRRGIQVIVIASGISNELRETATKCIEIPASFLDAPRKKKRTKDETPKDAQP